MSINQEILDIYEMSEEKYLKWEKYVWGGEWHIKTLGCWSPEEYKHNVCVQLKDILKRKGKESYKKALISILSQLRSEHYDWKDIIEYFTLCIRRNLQTKNSPR